MKLFPVLAKELLDKGQGPEATSLVEPSHLPEFQATEAKEVLAEIPEVTDPPEQRRSGDGDTSLRWGGRLFGPSLSARILLGGGLLLVFIAAMPSFFRSPTPTEPGKASSGGEGGQPPAPTASEAPKWLGSSGPSQTPDSASSRLQPGASKTSSATSLPSSPQTAQQVPSRSPDSPKGKENPGREYLSREVTASFVEKGEADRTSPVFSQQRTNPPPVDDAIPSSGGPYYPTSASYPTGSGQAMVYYPGTDGRWYPVAFPPGRPPRQPIRTASAWEDRTWETKERGTVGSDVSRGYPSTGYGPWEEYQEAVHRETGRTSPYGNGPSFSTRSSGEPIPQAYPAGRSPTSWQGPPPGPYSPQGPRPYEVPGASRTFDREMPSAASGRPEFSGASLPWNAGLANEEPGVARFQGTIEKPMVRSAYEGTGSSVY